MLQYPLTADVPTIKDVFSFLLPDYIRLSLPNIKEKKPTSGRLLTGQALRSADFKSVHL